ncbi:MAG: hypothetical protein IJN67_07300 [Oscillospiraceae bacterium]|nr:hypothetical protein [Oscillospiraceae bacterium]
MLLLRKRLMMDTNAQELARVKQILDKNGIRYEVKTTVSDNVLSRSFNAKAAETVRTTYSAMATQTYLYQLFVKPGDHARAKKLVYGK